MITYEEALARLNGLADEGYRAFHGRLLKNERIKLIGVRIPAMRALAKEWKGETDTFLTFPDEYYELTYLKCTLVGQLPYGEFIKRVDAVLPLVDNWATCDCFKASCIRKHREEFLPKILEYLKSEREFTRRYALVTLLGDYMEAQYLPLIFESAEQVCSDEYYVMMAAAWLIAEVLVKFYGEGVAFLKKGTLPEAVRARAIRKACESFRLSAEQKAFLKSLSRTGQETPPDSSECNKNP